MPVFNKMIYNGTEYILGGGGNIGEPLNLTVTTSGLDATIKWEDNEIGTIPPTTFQKSELVRKIGSAPTSPSDGVLVVTETVKDTYKTTGYVDQGLTDGETYYYRVFSYSDLGGISYCDAVNVTPSAGGWQPGVDTIAYYPLTSTTQGTDQSGNSRDLSNSGVTFGLYQGIDCGQFSGGGLLSYNLTIPTDWTIIGWVYHDNVDTNQVAFNIGGTLLAGRNCLGYYYNPGNNSIMLGQFYGGYETSSSINITGQWTNVCITYTAGNNIIYVNGLPKITRNDTISFRNDIWLGTFDQSDIGLYGGMSNIIFEDKVRTAQEIQDYYNLTKGNYGIS